jgi:adenosylhomocysteine nucleosidase
MKILVTFALENEFAPWRKMRRFQRVSVDEWDRTYQARVGEADVWVVVTGAGRFAVQRSLERAFDKPPDVCIASGLSGGLKTAYRPGAILAARAVGDVDGTKLVPGDPGLIREADDAGARIVEKFLLSNRVVSTAEQKRSLGESGDAVDMESLYVLGAAAHHGIRAVAIRAVSDSAESDLPIDFDHIFNERGAVSLPRIVGQLLKRPHRIGGLVRLAHESEKAAGALARFLDAYVQDISVDPLTEIAKAEALAL